MFLLLGRIIYLFIWFFLILNIFAPYMYPANIICYIALASFVLLHGIQTCLLAITLTKTEKKQNKFIICKFFIFGFIEALSWKKNT